MIWFHVASHTRGVFIVKTFMFVCNSNISLNAVCAKLQAEYSLPMFVFDEHSTWEYAISNHLDIKFNVTKTEDMKILSTWSVAIPEDMNFQIIAYILTNKYSVQSVKTFLENIFLVNVIQIQSS